MSTKKKPKTKKVRSANMLLATLLSTLEPPPLTLEQLRIKKDLELAKYMAHDHFEAVS